ncbi:TIGR01841 family phasin [Paraburkholderia sp. A3BS-1L]|uniref:TIGR01841 family phasin n=1 Tax=Paraburkholderia sp. A3BS-1L TaxID=3028375 RepID=UPI003DA99229
MSSLDLEQTLAARKASLETTFELLNKTFAGIENLAGLNLQTFKSTLAENQEIAIRALSAKDPAELFALQSGQTQPAVEKAQSYWRHVYEIVSGTQTEFTETLVARSKLLQHDLQAFVANLAKSAPAGSDAFLSAWKSAIETANTTFETTQKAAKEATGIAEGNVNAALDAPTKSTRRVAEQAEADEKK